MWPLNVKTVRAVSDIAPILTAEKAVVFMTVDWSGPERHSRELFRRFVLNLDEIEAKHIQFFAVNEDCDACRQRFRTSEYPGIAPLGVGTMFWIERGIVLDVLINPLSMSADGLVDRTRKCWDSRGSQLQEQ